MLATVRTVDPDTEKDADMSVIIKCDGCGRISDPPYAHWDSASLAPPDWEDAKDDERFDWCPWCLVRYGVRSEEEYPNLTFPAPPQIVVTAVEDTEKWEQARAILGLDKSRKKRPNTPRRD